MSRKRAQHAYRPAPRKALAVDPQAFGFMFCEPAEDEAELLDGGIAVVRVCGPLEHHAGWWGESYEAIEERLSAVLESGDVSAVVLRIDSPGGEVAGMAEMVRRMRSLKSAMGKTVVAYVDETAASAGYALATIADAIYAPPSGTVG
jgi:ClpP class serine protease